MAPTNQEAWIVKSRGIPRDAVVFEKEYPVKKPGKGEVIVKVQAAALNPVGYKVMGMLPNILARRPLVAEYDLAGIIEDPNGSDFQQGDEVFGFIPVPTSWSTREGALQQYACVPAANLVYKPGSVKFTEAAGFSLAGETAWQALFNCGQFEAGQTVFINGGSSAVGAYAIQIAKAKGAARVVASASGRNEDFVRSLGADEFIDYTKRPLYEHFSENPPSPKFHLIFDAVGLTDPTLFKRSPAYLAPGGTFVSVGAIHGIRPVLQGLQTIFAMMWPAWLGGVPRGYKTVFVNHKPSDLKQIQLLVKEGKIKPIVDSVYEFKDVHVAYERIMTGRAKGKVVVKVDPSTT